MPVFSDNKNLETKHNSLVRPVPPTEPNEPILMELDSASIYKDLQYSGEIVIGISGSPESVTYYSKLIKGDDLVTNASDIIDGTILQYKRINNFEIRTTAAPTFTLDDSENTSIITGTANLYPVLTPKIGDILVKAILTSRGIWGVFQVTNVERKSMYNEPVWAITFSQIRFSKNIRDSESDKFVFFEYDFLVQNLEKGQNPLIPTITNVASQNNKILRSELIRIYYNRFYDKETGTFLVPTEAAGNVYDPFVVKFWNQIVDKSILPGLEVPIECQINNPYDRKEFITVFDVYINQSPGLLWSAVKEMSNVSAIFFSAAYLKLTIFSTGIDSIVYPYAYYNQKETSLFPETKVDSGDTIVNWTEAHEVGLWINTHQTEVDHDSHNFDKCDPNGPQSSVVEWEYTSPTGATSNSDPQTEPDALSGVDIRGITDSSYIFSKDFYTLGIGKTLLETLILKVINKQTILLKDVYLALEIVKREKILNQYYHLLFIISLLQVAR